MTLVWHYRFRHAANTGALRFAITGSRRDTSRSPGLGVCEGCVPHGGAVEASDQLVVAPTNQGQTDSSTSTTRHVPRPSSTHHDTTCQSLRPAPFRRSLHPIHSRPWRARAVHAGQTLELGCHARTDAAFGSHRVLDSSPRRPSRGGGGGCISPLRLLPSPINAGNPTLTPGRHRP